MAQRGKIFEYAVIYHPRKKEKDEEQKKSKIIVDVTRVISATEQEVGILAAREIPTDYLDKLDEVEIAIRPF
jgi:hypothetical protein